MSSTNTQAQAMPSGKQILEVADEVHQSGWNMDGVPDGMLIDFAEMILSRYGAGQPAASAEPLRVFAQECAMGAYQESELREAALRALKYATAPVSAEPVGTIRHFEYSGIARNGFSQEAVLNDDVPVLPDGATLYAAPVAAQAQPDDQIKLADILNAARNAGWTFERHTDGVVCMVPQIVGEAQSAQSNLLSLRHIDGLRSLYAAQAQPAMPPLTDAMRAVIRNEHDVYGDEDALYAALCAAAQAQPLPDSLIPAAPDLEYLRSMADSTALPAFLRGQITAAVKALEAQAQQPVSGADWLQERADALYLALEVCSAELFAQCADQPRAMKYVEQARHALATEQCARVAVGRPAQLQTRPSGNDGGEIPQPSVKDCLTPDTERAEFEAWASDEGKFPHLLERVDGYYRFTSTQYYWAGWQARAALAQQDDETRNRALVEDQGLTQQDGDKVDAERYRAWRGMVLKEYPSTTYDHLSEFLPFGVPVYRYPTTDEWDAAIDAARKEQT